MRADTSVRHTLRHGDPRPGLRAIARILLAALAIATAWSGAGQAQATRPAISVSASIPAAPASQTPLTIRVGPPEALPKGCFIRIRGLPPTVALSEGHSIAPGSWAVPIAALPSLNLTLPAAASGQSEISITLVALDGSTLAESKSRLVIAAAAPDNQAPGGSASPPASILRAGTPPPSTERVERSAPPAEGGAKMTREQRERALRFVKHGDEQLAQGGVAQARLLYERAAEAGLAQGAMALAATYDAAELNRLGVRGLQPDRAAARRWYERARQLGAADAEQRLQRLGAN